nr:MAK10-like protein [Tanacetum cinerariifolium]
MGDENPICTLGDYFKPSHEGYMNTIELPVGNNVDPSPHGRILLPDFLLNSFHREGPQNSIMISRCSNNIMENLYPKHRLVSRTYYKKSLIMASTFGSKSKFFMTMSILSQDEPLTNWPLYCMEDPEQAFVEYASSRIDEARVPPSSNTELICTKEEDGDVMFIEIVSKDDNSCKEEPKAGEQEVEYFDIFLTRRNYTYVVDFMITEDISSIIDLRLSQVVLGKPFVEIYNMTHDPPEGVVRFTNENDEVTYKMPHKIE